MPTRKTKRGPERTALNADADVLVCGASFAGLSVARELAGSGARVLVIDRYEIGERQTSACAMPTTWLQALELMGSLRQSFGELVVHTPFHTARWPLPWSFSTFDYRELCELLWEQARSPELEFETATVTGRAGTVVQTDRGEAHAITDLASRQSSRVEISPQKKEVWIVAKLADGREISSEKMYVPSQGILFASISEESIDLDFEL